ncbi:putative short-chain dehydrogenase/reductase family protein [Paraphoma chrysanthemicola]|uniref:Short-chain dehydrogenase/reductase family protein n=1 Tax=Paraphoma chrysanthemicola TaxID=798071 RepID=A0A8K0RF93_9PLEO|nr:putative short-chain dehydrogenase/reductase family protein [Paraphoma chrysanthemicola]
MASMALPPYSDSLFKVGVKGIRVENKQPKPSLAGQTVLITGSNSGIGLACAQILPTLSISHLILAVRSPSKAEPIATSLRTQHPDLRVSVWDLDMLSYASITSFASRCYTLPRLDIAILNAGVGGSFSSRTCEATGHEETIQVNYLSTALLSILLLPVLAGRPSSRRSNSNGSVNGKEVKPGRLTLVGSGTALFAAFENVKENPLLPSFDAPYSGFSAAGERYATSKLILTMFVHTLSQHVSSKRVIINTVEPGLTSGTSLHRDFSGGGALFMRVMKKLSARTPEQAAYTYVDAVGVHGEESHGAFIMFWEVCGVPKVMHTDEGKDCMDRLWKETMEELKFADVREILASMK